MNIATLNKIKNLTLALWIASVIVFYIHGLTDNTRYDSYFSEEMTLFFLATSIVLYFIFLVVLIVLASKATSLGQQLKVFFLNILLTVFLFLFISFIAIAFFNIATTPTNNEETANTQQTSNANIECYVDGEVVYTTREACAKLSIKEPKTDTPPPVVYQEPTPTPTPQEDKKDLVGVEVFDDKHYYCEKEEADKIVSLVIKLKQYKKKSKATIKCMENSPEFTVKQCEEIHGGDDEMYDEWEVAEDEYNALVPMYCYADEEGTRGIRFVDD